MKKTLRTITLIFASILTLGALFTAPTFAATDAECQGYEQKYNTANETNDEVNKAKYAELIEKECKSDPVPATGGTSGTVGDVCSANVAQAVKDAAGCSGTSDGISKVIINVINGVVGILALVATVAVIVGGVQYMTSTGDPGKTKKAKDTILYALIGLIICALAYVIVNFVIINIINK